MAASLRLLSNVSGTPILVEDLSKQKKKPAPLSALVSLSVKMKRQAKGRE
jgi:hypothetical protein